MSQSLQIGFFVRMHRSLRQLLMLGVLLGLAVLCGWLLLQQRVGNEIRLEIEQRFAQHYPGYHVTVRDARLIEGRGIEIQGLAIYRRPEIEPVVYVHEIMVHSPIVLQDLVYGHMPSADRLRLRGVHLRGRLDEQGQCDLVHLWPPPRFGPRTPRISMQDATVHLTTGQSPDTQTFSIRDLNLEILPRDDREQHLAGDTVKGKALQIQGTGTADHLEQVRFEALLPVESGVWDLRGQVSGLKLSPSLYRTIPEPWRQWSQPMQSVEGRVSLDFHVSGDSRSESPPRFAVQGQWADGQIRDARLPFRLYDGRAQFRWDDRHLAIQNFYARNGATELELSWTGQDFSGSSPMSLEARARRLHLYQAFAQVLPSALGEVWQEYSPQGVVDADIQLDFDGQHWQPRAQVTCHDVSFVYRKFPYRLQRARGQITLARDVLSIELEAAASEQTVTINGRVDQVTGTPTGWLEIACPRPIPLDEKLLNAVVDTQARRVLESLRPGGALTVAGRFERRQPDGPTHRLVKIDLHNCTMRYDRFAYPLGSIRGTIVWDDRGWTFQNLSGRNRSGYIECHGSWMPTDDGGSLLTLNFTGTEIPLEDDLRDALHPGAQRVWRELRPQGALDHLQVMLQYRSAVDDLSIQVQAREWEKRLQDEGRSITLMPKSFPQRLNDLTGIIRYHDGQVQLQRMSARLENASISLDGWCRFESEDRWLVDVTNLVIERARFDRELVSALPKGWGKAIDRLSPRGDVSVHGALAIHGAQGQPPAVSWDLNVDLENVSLVCGLALEQVHGEVRLTGRSMGNDFFSRGDLQLDSLMYQDLQLTQIRGPLLIQPDRVVLGIEAEGDEIDGAPRSLVAQAFGGTISADIAVGLDDQLPFHLRAALEDGDLQQFTTEVSHADRDIRGKANAVVNLRGTAQGRHTWRGDGFVRLFEADIYEVPVMLALLKLLSIRPPDRTAFTSSNIDFRIQGEHLYFDRIDFHGDAISLKGHGEMNLDRQIDMKFYTLVGRREWEPAALRALLHQAAQQLLLIRATGTLDQPHLTREPLPMVRETLEQIFPEAAARNQVSWLNRERAP